VLIVVSIAAIISSGGHLSAMPFEPSHITNGFSGLAAGFPLAVYLFIGWENSAALAEETSNPRRNVPRAVYMSVALMSVGYLLYAYATVTGFKYSATAVNAATIPFISVSHNVAAWLAVFAYIAGMTSTLGVLISAVNSQARLIFNAGREGLLPRWLGKVHPQRRTPANAIFAFVAIATVIILVWALLHLIGGARQSGEMNALNFFVDSSTMGTILVLVVYFLSNLALPFYYRRNRPQEFSAIKHALLPVLGMVAVGCRCTTWSSPASPRRSTGSPMPRSASSWSPSATPSG
jgi:amino acid transporter